MDTSTPANASLPISGLPELTTLADTDLFVVVDDTDATTKKLTATNLAQYSNTKSFSPFDAKIATTADWTAARSANKKCMNFTGNNLVIALGVVTVTDSLTIYLSQNAGFSAEQFILSAGAILKIISVEQPIISSGIPTGFGYIKASPPSGETFVKGAGTFLHENITVLYLSGNDNTHLCESVQYGTNPSIFTGGGSNNGLNLTASGSVVTGAKVYCIGSGATNNLLVAGSGTTLINPTLINSVGLTGILATIDSGAVAINLRGESLIGSVTFGVAINGLLSGYSTDGSTTLNFSGTGSYIFQSGSKLPTATAGTNTTQIATTAFVAAAALNVGVLSFTEYNGATDTILWQVGAPFTISKAGTGLGTVTFTTALASTNYYPDVCGIVSAGFFSPVWTGNKTVNGFDFITKDGTQSININAESIYITINYRT